MKRSIERWFDSSCFVVPPAGRFGNSGINVLQGPGLNVHHLALVKRFRLTERFTLTDNAAVSNLFNHPHFNAPRNDISYVGPRADHLHAGMERRERVGATHLDAPQT